MIAFAHACSWRRRLDDWLGSENVIAERVLEFGSYQGMIACVAAGTGFAVVPKSVLGALQAADKIRERKPQRIAANRPHLAWRGQASLALEGLISMLREETDKAAPEVRDAHPALLGLH